MFQIRRNTTLYMALGVMLIVLVGALVGIVVVLTTSFVETQTTWPFVLVHFAVMTLVFAIVACGATMRRPFAIIATPQMKDQWYRYDTLAVGDAIAEQVNRDKVQIVINRDRARASGV
jgi:uncharacterized membrane protein